VRTLVKSHSQVARQPLVLEVAARTGLIERLKAMVRLLDTIQKGLNLFLNFKRGLFPRMAFLSNDELLELLVHCQAPRKMQPHLIKMFNGIRTLFVVSKNDLLPVQLRQRVAEDADPDGDDSTADFTLGHPELRLLADAAMHLVSFLGDAKSSLGDAKSSLCDANISLGDAKIALGDAKSFLGDVNRVGLPRTSRAWTCHTQRS
jgi:hypothetical protein